MINRRIAIPALLRAQADACGMLKPAALTALLGGTPAPTPHPNACIWKVGEGAKKLSVTKMRATGPAAEMVS
jgi:hypothetical protein